MHLTKLGRMLVVPVGLWVLLLLSTHSGGTQSPGVSSAGQQKQPEERDRLSKQVEDLRGPANSTRRRPPPSAPWNWSAGPGGKE